MNRNNEPWVKTASERYEDCIVGNRDGLLALKSSIDKAIAQQSDSPTFKSDFLTIVCTDDPWEKSEGPSLPKWQEITFNLVLFVWLLLLPILGLGVIASWLL
ncbi:hypothetical protein PVT67_10090 [Gallaecimonas kandeliae]|uniref:hypothetical protein n=1 Tax=Gallaecimonas kandeliae TaxID=3029055 RepID=UPI0026488A5D|nr:hypothetical protein [Gallaecimonas kandeliae]WKE64050.1 hypothetical protein PVT67_10090 [Gallaecimonas kandeliae]